VLALLQRPHEVRRTEERKFLSAITRCAIVRA
jgi:hypothetical protein